MIYFYLYRSSRHTIVLKIRKETYWITFFGKKRITWGCYFVGNYILYWDVLNKSYCYTICHTNKLLNIGNLWNFQCETYWAKEKELLANFYFQHHRKLIEKFHFYDFPQSSFSTHFISFTQWQKNSIYQIQCATKISQKTSNIIKSSIR